MLWKYFDIRLCAGFLTFCNYASHRYAPASGRPERRIGRLHLWTPAFMGSDGIDERGTREPSVGLPVLPEPSTCSPAPSHIGSSARPIAAGNSAIST